MHVVDQGVGHTDIMKMQKQKNLQHEGPSYTQPTAHPSSCLDSILADREVYVLLLLLESLQR